MNIWEWVDQTRQELVDDGEIRLAQLMTWIPSAVCDDEHDATDAMVPEALSLARAIDHGWAELFLRHWSLQSLLLHRSDVKGQLEEAVSLFEFAHRDENMGCPQSVCVTQDLAVAYGLLDGPGYAQERIDVAEETLARIDATWNCFSCISSELSSALVDAGRAEEAVTFIDQQRDEVAKFYQGRTFDWNATSMLLDKSIALFETGEVDQALELAKVCEQKSREIDQMHRVTSAQIEIAVCHAAKGDAAAAFEALPSWDEIFETPSYIPRTVRMFVELNKAGEFENTWSMSLTLLSMITSLDRRHVNRDTISGAELFMQLALERGSALMATRGVKPLKESMERLREPPENAAELLALCDMVEAKWAQELAQDFDFTEFESPDDITLGEDPEVDLAILERLARQFPEREDVVLTLADLWGYLRFGRAATLLSGALLRFPDSVDVLMAYVNVQLQRGETEALEESLREILVGSGPRVPYVRFYLAQLLRDAGDFGGALEELELAHGQNPGLVGVQVVRAEVLHAMGEFAESAAAWRKLISAEEPDPSWYWDAARAGTCAEDWELVRECAANLGIELEGEGPVDEDMGVCAIRCSDGVELWAQRRGPTSAVIVELSTFGTPQRYGDSLVFEPSPLNLPAEGEEQPNFFVFPEDVTVASGGFRPTMELEGFHPGDEALEELTSQLEAVGGVFQIRSDERYQMEWDGQDVTAIYAVLSVPEDQPMDEVVNVLTTFAAGCDLELFFPSVLDAAGQSEQAAQVRVRMAELDFEV